MPLGVKHIVDLPLCRYPQPLHIAQIEDAGIQALIPLADGGRQTVIILHREMQVEDILCLRTAYPLDIEPVSGACRIAVEPEL